MKKTLIILLTFTAVSITTPAFALNHVLSLDGNGDYVRIPNALELQGGENVVKTIEAWFMPKTTPFPVIGKTLSGEEKDWAINLDEEFRIHFHSEISADDYRSSPPADIPLSQWYHVVVVINRPKRLLRLYLNGALVVEDANMGNESAKTEAPVEIGSYSYRPSYAEGYIDEVRIWNVVRTEEQIRDTMFRTLHGNELGLIGYWQFEDQGEKILDSTKNGNHGEVVGDAKRVAMNLPTNVQPLPKPALLSGVVTDEKGKPISNVSIRLEQGDLEIIQTITNQSGQYQIRVHPDSGLHDLSATSGELGDWQLGFRLHEGERRKINLTLKKAINIEGTLLMLDDTTPHVAVLVQAVQGDKVVDSTLSDRKGNYRFVNLKPGQYQVRCRIPTGDKYYESSLRVQSGKTIYGVDFRFPPFKKGTWGNFDSLDGLVGDQVNSLHIDKHGYLWIGTDMGVSRFDGKEFVNYTTKDGLTDETVWVIYEDRQGDLWFGTGWYYNLISGNGVSRYDGVNFITYTTEDGLAHNTVYAIQEDKQGNFWFGTHGGVSCFDGRSFLNYTTKDGLADNRVLSIHLDQKGNLWFGTWRGISRFDGKEFINYTKENGLANNIVYSIQEDKQGKFWFGTYGGISCFNGKEFINYITKDGLIDNPISCIYIDSQGNLWLGTGIPVGAGGGVSRFDGVNFVNYTELENYNVSAIDEDRYGRLWFGIRGGGISSFDSERIVNYTTKDGLLENKAETIYIDSHDNLWVGTTEGGVSHFLDKNIINYTQQNGLADNVVTEIIEDQRGRLWFGSISGRGISCYDGENFFKYTSRDGVGVSWIFSTHRDRHGNLWFGGYGGLSQYDGEKFVNYTTEDGLAMDNVWAIGEDRQGNLWFGTQGAGVSRYDGKDFVTYTTENGLPDNVVRAIYVDRHSNLWFGTYRGGISRYNGERFITYTTDDGMAHNSVTGIHEDSNGHLWLGTEGGGVIHYDGTAFQSLDTQDGIADDHIHGIEEDENGLLWFATNKGISRYQRDTTPPRAKLVAVTTDKRYTNLSLLKPLTAGTRVTIEYTSIDLKTHPDKRLYRYQMKGYDDDWRKPTKATQVDYTILKPGQYAFEVQAIDRDLNYSEPVSVTLNVVLPFYLRAGFLIPTLGGGTVIIAILTIISIGYVKRRSQVRAYEQAAVKELQDANRVQMLLMPQESPEIEGVEIAGKCLPANTVSGDFFDYLECKSENEIGLVVADVTGKAMKGAMNAVMADGILRMAAEEMESLSPASLMMKLNGVLKARMERDMNVTMVIGVIRILRNRVFPKNSVSETEITLTLANAAHHAHPLLLRDREIQTLKTGGLPLGMRSGTPYSEEQFPLQSGDVLILMTDGIIEARDSEENDYSDSGRLEEIISKFTQDMSAEAMVDAIIEDAMDFGGGKATRDDDMTVVVGKIQ